MGPCNTGTANQDFVRSQPHAIHKRERILQDASHVQCKCSKSRILQDPSHMLHTNSKCTILQRASYKQTDAKYTISLMRRFLMLFNMSLSLFEGNFSLFSTKLFKKFQLALPHNLKLLKNLAFELLFIIIFICMPYVQEVLIS